MASCRVENRAKKAQNGTVSASQFVKASQNAIFFSTQQISIVLLYCVQSLVGKSRFLATKKSSEKSMYSVPSFGGHIAISRDVTISNSGYPPHCMTLYLSHTVLKKDIKVNIPVLVSNWLVRLKERVCPHPPPPLLICASP